MIPPPDGMDYPSLYRCAACGERFAKEGELAKHFEDLERAGELAVHCISAAAKALFGDKNPKRRATPRKTMQ
jgi:hypothetical protein